MLKRTCFHDMPEGNGQPGARAASGNRSALAGGGGENVDQKWRDLGATDEEIAKIKSWQRDGVPDSEIERSVKWQKQAALRTDVNGEYYRQHFTGGERGTDWAIIDKDTGSLVRTVSNTPDNRDKLRSINSKKYGFLAEIHHLKLLNQGKDVRKAVF